MATPKEFDVWVDKEVFASDNFKIYACTPVEEGLEEGEAFYKNAYDNITITGNLPTLYVGNKYKVEATPEKGKYGWGYKVKKIKQVGEKTEDEVRNFLSYILVDSQVETLMEHYPNIVSLVENNKTHEIDVSKLKGIGEDRLRVVVRKIQENYMLQDVINEFYEYGLTLSVLRNLLNQYGSVEKVKESIEKDPYEALYEVDRIGFKSADKIVLKINPEMKENLSRYKGAIFYFLEQNENNGHTRLAKNELIKLLKDLKLDRLDLIEEVLNNPKIVTIGDLVVMLKHTYDTEIYVSTKLFQMAHELEQVEWHFEEGWLNDTDVQLTDEQKQGIRNVFNHNLSLLAGVSGSGKSMTMGTLIKILRNNRKKIALCAPSGKASVVMQQYANHDASTVHRLLEYNPETGWGRDAENPLTQDLVVLDETSMADVFLMRRLLEAIDPTRTKLLFVGDNAQIPSVSCGNVWQDMLQSKMFPTTYLTKVFRYKEGGLAQVATKAREGNKYFNSLDQQVTTFGEKKDYVIIKASQEQTVPSVMSVYNSLYTKGVEPKDIIIASSMNKYDYGTVAINKHIQNYLVEKNHLETELFIQYGSQKYYVKDIVVQTQNNYKLLTEYGEEIAVFNGMLGRILSINRYGNSAIVEVNGKRVVYSKADFENVSLGYSISAYKMQGSQIPYLIMITPKSHTYMLNRNLLYTTMTRTQQKCFHITEEKIIFSALKKSENFSRNTMMQAFLRKLYLNKENIDGQITS